MKKDYFWIALALYVTAGAFLFPIRLHFIHPDGTAYISIAEKYARGNFSEAVNECWAPLISWLIAIPIRIGFDSLAAAKVVTLMVGLLALLGAKILAKTVEFSGRVQFLMFLALAPVFLSFALFRIGPDLLLMSIWLFYLSVLLKRDYLDRRANAILCGVIAAISYYAKQYAFPFFLAHFFCMHGLFWIGAAREERKTVIRQWAAGTLVFLVLTLPWMTGLYFKYEKVTIGSPTIFDWKMMRPGVHYREYPYDYQGFFVPTNNTAVSFWEDPLVAEMESWSPLESKENAAHFLEMLRVNFWSTCHLIARFSPAVAWVFTAACLSFSVTFVLRRRELFQRLGGLLFAVAFGSLGYLIFIPQPRYFYLSLVIFMILGVLMLRELYPKSLFRNRWVQMILEVILLFSFVPPAMASLKDLGKYTDYLPIANTMKDLGIQGKTASNADWANSLNLSYHMKASYYGKAAPDMSAAQIAKELKRWDIDYYLIWKEKSGAFAPMPPLNASKKFENGDLQVYELQKA